MKTFFSIDERERLRNTYMNKGRHVLDVFTSIDQERLEELLSGFENDYEGSIDHLDVTLGHVNQVTTAQLQDPANRQTLLSLLEKWVSFTQLDVRGSEPFLEYELGLGGPDKERDIGKKLNSAFEKIELAGRYQALQARFPYLITGIQISHILTLDKKGLVTLKPQFEFMDGLSIDDIGKGNIDYKRMRELTKFHSPFTASFLTMQDMRDTTLPENHLYFPIVNTNFPGKRRFDFKGVVEVIPEDLFSEINSIDPRFYMFGYEGVKFKNFVTASIMGVKNGAAAAKNLCRLLKNGDFQSLNIQLDKSLLMNIGMLSGDRELIDLAKDSPECDVERQAQMIDNMKTTAYDSLKRTASENHMPITHANLEQAVEEVIQPGLLVSFRYARKQQGYSKAADAPKQVNPTTTAIDIIDRSSVVMPTINLYIDMIRNDFDRIIREGARKLPNGGKFYSQHRAFFERYKSAPESVDTLEIYKIATQIIDQMQDRDFREFGMQALNAANSTSERLMRGIATPDQMHYLSLRMAPQVLIEPMNGLNPGDLLMGYGNNNCLRVADMIRYHMSSDARLYAFWLNGLKLGMSYDLLVSQPKPSSSQKSPLIDSIELSDAFFTEIKKFYKGPNDTEIPDSFLTHSLVFNYLVTRVQHSENGVFIVPESNNYHARTAMNDFIRHYNGQPVLAYSGITVETDTDFKRMPFWIERSAVTAELKGKVLDQNGAVVDPSEIPSSINPALSPESSEEVTRQIGRILR